MANVGVLFFVVLGLLLAIVGCEMTNESAERAIQDITSDSFVDFKDQKIVSVVYFYKKDLPRLATFLVEYEKSAKLINVYGVQFGMVDCTKVKLPEYCETEDTENKVYIFRAGMELLDLALETMFDVNSIVSNVLQLVLLREVPILQAKSELQQYENENKGKFDVIFSYQRAIGTYEHRILMEVASAYHGKYKFALTTEESTAETLPDYNEKDESAIWLLKCKLASQKDPCSARKYLDKMDLASLARFVRVLELSPLHDIASDGAYNPYEANDMHTVFVYYDMESKNLVTEETEQIVDKYQGILGIIMVDVNAVDAMQYGFQQDWKIPALAVKRKYEDEFYLMPPSVDTPDKFIQQIIIKMEIPEEKSPEVPKEEDPDDIPEEIEDDIGLVEKQDDTVAKAVYKLRKKPIDRSHIPALTDKTFPVESENKDLLMILFYLTFDVRSMAFLRSYSEASRQLAEENLYPLAAVDCFDWTDVCGDNNITSYPVIRIYRRGQKFQNYQNMLSAKAVVSTVKLYLADAPVLLTSSDEGALFLEGKHPRDIGLVTEVSVLGLQTSQNKKEISRFKDLARQMQGQLLFGMAVDDVAKQMGSRFNIKPPYIVVYKRHDSFQPFKVLSTDKTTSQLKQAITEASLPVFPELTAVNFPSYFAKKQPLVLYFTDDLKFDGYKILGKMAAGSDFSSFTFCWMKVDSDESLPHMVLMTYLSRAPEEAVVVVNHHKGTIHYLDRLEVDQLTVSKWLNDVLTGKEEPFKMLEEGNWKPLHKGYDFLSMIDYQESEERKRSHGSDLDFANEHGIGFGADDEMKDERPDQVYVKDEVVQTEIEDPENDIRAELHSLRNSRLYHTSDARTHHKKHGQDTRHMPGNIPSFNIDESLGDLESPMTKATSKQDQTPSDHTEL